jgi:hypothetical protein
MRRHEDRYDRIMTATSRSDWRDVARASATRTTHNTAAMTIA